MFLHAKHMHTLPKIKSWEFSSQNVCYHFLQTPHSDSRISALHAFYVKYPYFLSMPLRYADVMMGNWQVEYRALREKKNNNKRKSEEREKKATWKKRAESLR